METRMQFVSVNESVMAESDNGDVSKSSGFTEAALRRINEIARTPDVKSDVTGEAGTADININQMTGNDDMTAAMIAVYSGEMSAYRASRVFNVGERTLNRRIEKNRTEGVVKKGRKFQMLPAEENKFCEYLEWMSANNIHKGAHQFLDEIKHHFDRLQVKTDFEFNRPGQGWYNNFSKRNAEKLQRHTLSPLRTKIMNHFQTSYERARNNSLARLIRYSSKENYLCTTRTFQLMPQKHLTLMVLLNAEGKLHSLLCYPEEYGSDEMQLVTEQYPNIKFIQSAYGKMTADEYVEAARLIFPTCENRTSVFCVWPKDVYSYTVYKICTRRNLSLIALDEWLNELVIYQKHLLSKLDNLLTIGTEQLESTEQNAARCALVKMNIICDGLSERMNLGWFARTCQIYGVYPTGTYWLYRHIPTMEISDKMKELLQPKVKCASNGPARTTRSNSVNTITRRGNRRSQYASAQDGNSNTEEDAFVTILRNSEVSKLLLRLATKKVCLVRKPRRSQIEIEAEKRWRDKDRKARKDYWRRVTLMRYNLRRCIDREQARRRANPKPSAEDLVGLEISDFQDINVLSEQNERSG